MVSQRMPATRCTESNFSLPSSFWRAPAEMDRWFASLVDALAPAGLSSTGAAAASLWEDADGLHVELDLPGVKAEDLEITTSQGRLRMVANRRTPEGERKYYLNQQRFGRVERLVTLPEQYDPDSIQAELHDGVLHVCLTKRPEAQPRKVEVRTG